MVEKTYALHLPMDDGLQHQLSNRDGEGLFQLFYGFMLPLLSRFYRYSKTPTIDLVHDPMSFKSWNVKAKPHELKKLTKQIQDLIAPYVSKDEDGQTIALVLTPPIDRP